jgi:hypothetical protein
LTYIFIESLSSFFFEEREKKEEKKKKKNSNFEGPFLCVKKKVGKVWVV